MWVTYSASVGEHLADKIQLILAQQPVHVFVHSLAEVCNLEQLNATQIQHINMYIKPSTKYRGIHYGTLKVVQDHTACWASKHQALHLHCTMYGYSCTKNSYKF